MREMTLRRFHRYLGAVAAPLVLLQAGSGLMLSVDLLGRWQSRVQRFLEDVDLPALAAFWNTVLHEIHFGSGSVGFVHNVAVGLSLTLLAVSGLLLFVKVLARTLFRRPAAAATQEVETASEQREPGPRWRVAAALAVTAMALMGLDVYIFSAAQRMIGLHVPHLYGTAAVETHVLRGRVALGEFLAGVPESTLERLRDELGRTERVTATLLQLPKEDGGKSVGFPPGHRVLPVENRALRRRLEGIAQSLHHLQSRLPESGTEFSPAEATAYRRALAGLQASAQGLVEANMNVVEQDRDLFFTIHFVLFTAASLFLVAVGAVLYVYETGRARHLAAVRTARDIAKAYEARFREVVRQAADPLLVLDDRGRVIAASCTAATLLGYTEEQLRSSVIGDIARWLAPGELEAFWAEFTPGAPVAAKGSWRRQDGTEIPVVLSLGIVAAEGEDRPLVLVHARLERDAGPPTASGDEG